MSDTDPNRRLFLKQALLASGGAWLAAGLDPVMAAAQAALTHDGNSWQVLSEAEAAALAGVADGIWPPDDTPGAAAVGAVRFMDVALGGFMAGALPLVRSGLVDLDARAAALGANGFVALDSEQQSGVLEAVSDSRFFGVARFMTLCGLFALPSWGGNLDREGWKELGFEARHAWSPPFGAYDAAAAGEVGHGD